jgi:shikimate kinase
MMPKIFLIGFMGSGKSTIGKKLAKLMQLPFIDLDKEIEKKAKCSVSDIFKYLGEESFREMESEVLKSFENETSFVMATGGGTPCYFDNLEYIHTQGKSIYIELDTKSIYYRLSKAKNIRPTIKEKKEAELLRFIEQTFEKRKHIYEQANYKVNGLTVDVKKVIELLES